VDGLVFPSSAGQGRLGSGTVPGSAADTKPMAEGRTAHATA
jgi:hypothetical protein